uniref:NADH dehydrogenase subunit 2 n=1 Tax=Lebertia trifurcilla TaxID=450597 RepID=UPI002113B7D0|nr:NADH dehydrogenase subunit 2 [Lebertia trifurcilla]UTE89518.1 NADH dehydrogenase subunit 2 [Lebertia trifurcilla]
MWTTLIIAPIGAITMKNWILIWVFLELSSFSFIVLSKNKSTSESILKYFLIQTLSSILILASIIMKMPFPTTKSMNWFLYSPILLIISLSLKSGLAPLHIWMPNVSKGLEWKSLWMFLTIQKFAPIMLMLSMINILLISIIILLCSIIGTMSQMSTLELKILLTYSSISHSSWIILGGMMKMEIFMLYMIIYSTILYQIILTLSKKSTKSIIQMKSSKTSVILFMSLGGLPPLLGFFPKWVSVLTIMSENNMKMVCLFILLMACLNIYIYTRILFSSILKEKEKSKNFSNSKEKPFSMFLTNSMAIPILIMFST